MDVDKKIIERLEQLLEETRILLTTAQPREISSPRNISPRHAVKRVDEYSYVNEQKFEKWRASCLSYIGKVFGRRSTHYTLFVHTLKDRKVYCIKRALGVLESAKEEYEGGYLTDTRVLIEAEVFDDFLEQAEHLLDRGYMGAAAVIAGCVLEDGLRRLCSRSEVKLSNQPKLDSMNSELAKKGLYNKLVQKQITALADLRNKAAHGHWDQFSKEDVYSMLNQVRSIMANHFSR